MGESVPRKIANQPSISKALLILVGIATIVHFAWWLNLNNIGHPVLYGLLFVGQVFFLWQAVGYILTIWGQKKIPFKPVTEAYPVDIFITVCGEPVSVVEKTLKAAVSMHYPNFKVYILNDGFVAKKDNWKEIDDLAKRYGAIPITRTKPGGAKAGNVNNALSKTESPFIAVFDADHIPEKNFLARTMGYFNDEKMALVQTPQYYENKEDNYLTEAAWEQQELFFGPICNGKNASNATFWCGTNAVIRREALEEIGGVPENNIAEDFLASLFMHEKGWRSTYVPEILAKGLAPHNLGDYSNQQFRWARGSLEVIFKYNPLFRKGLTWRQKVQYLYSSGYYLTGIIVLINALVPLIALSLNILPVNAATTDFMVYFFPFIFLTIFLLMKSTNNQITFKAIQLSISSFFIFITAMFSTIFNVKSAFKVTSKSKESGNYLKLVIPHLIYTVASLIIISIAVYRNGFIPFVVTNASWALYNIAFFYAFVRVAYPWSNLFSWLKGKETTTTTIAEEKNIAYVYTDSKLEGRNDD
jgi:cellulose synthase (UDP-forming)